MRNNLTLGEVPAELEQHYKTVDLRLNNEVDTETRSIKGRTRIRTGEERVEHSVMDANFEVSTATGIPARMFLVRVNEINDGVVVRAILPMEVYNEVEVLRNS